MPKPTAWSDRTDRWPDDARLRAAGWRIARRPANGEAVWLHPCGVEMTEREAVATLAKAQTFKGMGR
jgi:hypothetical protein